VTLSEWKSLAVTQEFMAELNSRIESYTEQLVTSAGVSPVADSYRSGAIMALRDVVDFHFDTEETQ
jgi:hypothetical protein